MNSVQRKPRTTRSYAVDIYRDGLLLYSCVSNAIDRPRAVKAALVRLRELYPDYVPTRARVYRDAVTTNATHYTVSDWRIR